MRILVSHTLSHTYIISYVYNTNVGNVGVIQRRLFSELFSEFFSLLKNVRKKARLLIETHVSIKSHVSSNRFNVLLNIGTTVYKWLYKFFVWSMFFTPDLSVHSSHRRIENTFERLNFAFALITSISSTFPHTFV